MTLWLRWLLSWICFEEKRENKRFLVCLFVLIWVKGFVSWNWCCFVLGLQIWISVLSPLFSGVDICGCVSDEIWGSPNLRTCLYALTSRWLPSKWLNFRSLRRVSKFSVGKEKCVTFFLKKFVYLFIFQNQDPLYDFYVDALSN